MYSAISTLESEFESLNQQYLKLLSSTQKSKDKNENNFDMSDTDQLVTVIKFNNPKLILFNSLIHFNILKNLDNTKHAFKRRNT